MFIRIKNNIVNLDTVVHFYVSDCDVYLEFIDGSKMKVQKCHCLNEAEAVIDHIELKLGQKSKLLEHSLNRINQNLSN